MYNLIIFYPHNPKRKEIKISNVSFIQDKNTLSIVNGNLCYEIVIKEVRFAKDIHIEGIDITVREKPIFCKILIIN